MTRTFQLLLFAFFLIGVQSCKGQSGKKQGEELQTKVNGIMDAYKHPTSKSGLYVEAKVDGEKWAADWMFIDPDPSNSINVNAHKEDGAVISFYIGKTVIKEKGSHNFSESNPVQMFDNKSNLLSGKEGGYQITNVTDNWIEGNFHFTAKDESSGTTHQVTDGFFRVSIPESFKKKLNM
jgi:hypothetical protein